jgi:hypothetical protein
LPITTGNTPKALWGGLAKLKSLPKPKKPKSKETLPAYCGGRPQAFRADGR